MSVALCRFSIGDEVVLTRKMSDRLRRFARSEVLTVAMEPYDRTYHLADRDGHTLWRVSEHDLLARNEAFPVGWARISRALRSLLTRIFPGSEA